MGCFFFPRLQKTASAAEITAVSANEINKKKKVLIVLCYNKQINVLHQNPSDAQLD